MCPCTDSFSAYGEVVFDAIEVMGTAAALKHLYNGAMAPIAESPDGLRGVPTMRSQLRSKLLSRLYQDNEAF